MVTQSASQADGNCSPREEKFRSRLWDLYYKFLDPNTAENIWFQLLTLEERAKLGSLSEAYEIKGRGISIYARAKNVSLEAAIVELTRHMGFPEIDYLYLSQELSHFTGEQISPLVSVPEEKPKWYPDRNELWFQGECVRSVNGRTIATNLHPILDVFEEEGWPSRIDDPLPNGPDSERLRSTVYTLNRGLQSILFRADGAGEGIRWERLEHTEHTEDQTSESN